MTYCAIDFGTSNSAVAISTAEGMRLVPLEGQHLTMPTAVFYCTDRDDIPPGAHPAPALSEPPLPRCFGRTAVQAYMDGYGGRLMRSMKSILGSPLVEQTTEVGEGYGVKYLDIITTFLRQLRDQAQVASGEALRQVVMGRPVYFVDDDALRDAQAQASLTTAARSVGFEDVHFQFEPIAAAFDYEQTALSEQKVLVVDIGGGTSDFSVVRVGPDRLKRLDRRDDILANHGIHIAGTDFDRHVSLHSVMPPLGYGAFGPSVAGAPPRPVPSRVYFDLSTWHLINTVYQPARVAELKGMGGFYGNPAYHTRLMKVVLERLGHNLISRAESAKIDVATHGTADLDLSLIERELKAHLTHDEAAQALAADLQRIVHCAQDTVQTAGLRPQDIDAVYFTGGSTGLSLLTDQIEAAFPQAQAVRGDRLASVATGLGLHARRLFTA
ncbi:MAG: Hsp70 family protein [Burkholderiales bacterium]|nr:Hsp70 family protein [Burkholderiales bacterium]